MKQLVVMALAVLALAGCGVSEQDGAAEDALATRTDALCTTSTECWDGSVLSCQGATCTADAGSVTCDGVKQSCPQKGCIINGQFYYDGVTNPYNTCQYCSFARSRYGWTNKSDGFAGGGICKYNRYCGSGPCGGSACRTAEDCNGYCQNGQVVCPGIAAE